MAILLNLVKYVDQSLGIHDLFLGIRNRCHRPCSKSSSGFYHYFRWTDLVLAGCRMLMTLYNFAI